MATHEIPIDACECFLVREATAAPDGLRNALQIARGKADSSEPRGADRRRSTV